MKRLYIFAIAMLVLGCLNSCSPYKNGTTPDDVYYAPGKPAGQGTATQNTNSDYYSTPNENYVKMKAEDPARWSYFDDYNTDYYATITDTAMDTEPESD